MKYKILLIIIISFSFLFAEQPEEFQFNQSSEQCFYFVQSAELDEVSLTEDDWIGAFNNDICVGSSVWEGEFTTIAVMGDDGFAYSSGYCENGDIPLFKVWDSETEQIWEFSDNSAIPGWNSNGTYIIENIGAYTASPKIEISTTELIFDDTIVNETSIGNFYIRNIGEETLTGSVSAPQFFQYIQIEMFWNLKFQQVILYKLQQLFLHWKKLSIQINWRLTATVQSIPKFSLMLPVLEFKLISNPNRSYWSLKMSGLIILFKKI